MKGKESSKQVFEFEESYPYKLNLIQRYHSKPGFDFFVTLIETLSQYQFKEDAVPGGHSNTIFQQDNLAEILLALFILW